MFTDEQVGELIASQARCEQAQERLSMEMGNLSGEVKALSEAKTQGTTGVRIFRWVVAGACVLLMAVGSWLLTDHLSQGNQLVAHAHDIQAIKDSATAHERTPGHEGMRTLRGDVRVLRSDMNHIRETTTSTQDTLETIQQDLRRGSRWRSVRNRE